MGIFGNFGNGSNKLRKQFDNLVTKNLYKWIGKDWQVYDPAKFNFIEKGYMDVPYAYEAITLITNKIKQCPVIIYEVENSQKLKAYENALKAGNLVAASGLKAQALKEVDVRDIRKLIDRPNPKQSFDDFMSMICVQLLASGNALIYGVKPDGRSSKIGEVWALPFNPQQYTIISDGIFDPIKSYRVIYNGGDSKIDFKSEDIYHFKSTNPLWETTGGQLYGMSPLRPYISKLLRSKLGDSATNRILSNGFKMGIISPEHKEDNWTPEQGKQLKEQIRRTLMSNEAYERIMPSSISVGYTPIGLDSTELGVLDLQKSDREDIYRAYQIPLVRASNDSATYNNMRESNRQLIYDAVAPWCELISDGLTKFIADPVGKSNGKKYIIKLDYVALPELGADMKELSEWLDKSPEITLNERREAKGYGRLDLPGMDEPILESRYTTLNNIINGKVNTGDTNV